MTFVGGQGPQYWTQTAISGCTSAQRYSSHGPDGRGATDWTEAKINSRRCARGLQRAVQREGPGTRRVPQQVASEMTSSSTAGFAYRWVVPNVSQREPPVL